MTLDEMLVGRDSRGRVVVRNAGSEHLDPADAAWLRDRIDEELALLDGGEVRESDGSPTGSDDEGQPGEMGAPEYRDDGGAEAESESESADATNPLDVECEVCGRGFDSETGKNIHKGRMHDCDDGSDNASASGRESEDAEVDGSEMADDADGMACPECGEEFAGARGVTVHHTRVHGDDEDQRDGANDDGPDGDGLEPLDPGDVEGALAEYDVPHEVDVSDVVQAVDGSSQYYEVGKKLSISRPSAQVLVGKLGLDDALDSDDGLAARRLQLAESSGGEA